MGHHLRRSERAERLGARARSRTTVGKRRVLPAIGALLAAALVAGTAAAAPNTTTTAGNVQILATRAWGSPKAARFAPSKTGSGAIAALEYAPKLVVRRIAFSSTTSAPVKEATFAPANRTAKFQTWTEDDQGNVFLLYKATSAGGVSSTRLARVDPSGAIAFDVEFDARGCADIAPDGAGGGLTASYAPKLAPESTANTGRTRVARYSPQGALAWESVGVADVTYVAGSCAVATGPQGAVGAFTLAANGNTLAPGNVRFVRVGDGGTPLGHTDGVSWPASAGSSAVSSLLLSAKEAWPLADGGSAVLGRDPQQRSWLVRYDKAGKVSGGIQVQEPLAPMADGTFVAASPLALVRYAPSGVSFAKSTIQTSPFGTDPSHQIEDLGWAGRRWIGWGRKTSTNFAALAFLSPEGSRLGSFVSSVGGAFGDTVFGVAASNSQFLLLQKDAAGLVRLVIGTYSLGGTAPRIELTKPGLPPVKPIGVR